MHSCREKHNKPRSKAAAETLPQGSLPLPLEMMESRSQSATWFVQYKVKLTRTTQIDHGDPPCLIESQ